MYSGFKLKATVFQYAIRFSILYYCLLASFTGAAQNTTSPYSILGIGDIDTREYGRYSSGASIARRDEYSYNFSNPASLTALSYKTMNMGFDLGGRLSSFKYPGADTATGYTKDMVIKRVSLAFRFTEKSAFAFGLKPYSSVNYQYAKENSVASGSAYNTYVEGTGGLNQVYGSFGHSVTKNLSVGITASWLFGSLQKGTAYNSQLADFNLLRSEIINYAGGSLQAGLQYEINNNRKWIHRFGLTAVYNGALKGQSATTFTDATAEISYDVSEAVPFKMPVSVAAGYSAFINNSLHLSADASFYRWPYQKVNYKNSYTGNASRYAASIEYAPVKKTGNAKRTEKFFLSAGLSYETQYIKIDNKPLHDIVFSAGGGYNISRNLTANVSLGTGRKGELKYNQIRENYTQFNVGFTLKNIWLGTKKYGKFD
jgi:hypothetical protein